MALAVLDGANNLRQLGTDYKKDKMNIYTNNKFSGFYSVGTAAVIVSATADIATAILNAQLEARGLPADADEMDMKLLGTDEEGVRILCDGNY